MTLHPSILVALCASLLCGALSGCGSDSRPPSFKLHIESRSAIRDAVREIRLIFKPEADERFRAAPPATHEDGAIESLVTPEGWFEIRINGSYVSSRGVIDVTAGQFYLDVPVWSTDTSATQEMRRDPRLDTVFLRNGFTIAAGQRFVPWPLRGGEEVSVQVTCLPDQSRGCANLDGMDPTDAGGADAGTIETDSGATADDAGEDAGTITEDAGDVDAGTL